MELISSIIITSKFSYKRKIQVSGTSEKAEGVMSAEVAAAGVGIRERHTECFLPSSDTYRRKA